MATWADVEEARRRVDRAQAEADVIRLEIARERKKLAARREILYRQRETAMMMACLSILAGPALLLLAALLQ